VPADTETPPAPAVETDASQSSATGTATAPAVTNEAGAAADVAVTSETAGKSKAAAKSEAGGKSKSAGKAKAKKKGKSSEEPAAAGDEATVNLAAHPRAARRVAEAKAWGALAGFALGGYLSLSTYTFVDAGLRALAAGVICYMAVWAGSVFVWRRVVIAELRQAEQDLLSANIAARQPNELPALPAGRAAAGAPS
jgi:hypothetical protein